MKIDSLTTYPIKSAKGYKTDSVVVEKIGFQNDRCFAICDSKRTILTAREFPALLKIKTEITKNELMIRYHNESIKVSLDEENEKIQLSLFKEPAQGKRVNDQVSEWLSAHLGIACDLVRIDQQFLRNRLNATISFSDLSPVHLTLKESIDLLNEKLEEKVEVDRFRANIVVSGMSAFEENTITGISIGDCEFKTISKTKRCSLITINPISGEKSNMQEPLRTLAKEFRGYGKAEMGIYLVPTKTGTISIHDELRIIKSS